MTDHPSALVSVPDAIIAACKGEQEHFEGWAKSSRYDMSEHPLHYIFLDPKTDAARRGWNAALAYVRNNAAAPAAPQAAGVGEREAIARIMDPKGWETRDRQYDAIKRSTMHDKDRPLAFANADYYTRDSLTKADAILALRAPSREPEGGAVRQVIIGFDVEEYVDGYEFRGDEGSYTPTENERALITDAIHGVLSELSLATREEAPADPCASHKAEGISLDPCCPTCYAPAEAGGEREDVAEIIDPAAFDDGPVHPQHLSGRRKLALAKADAILALRAQPQAREDAQPVGGDWQSIAMWMGFAASVIKSGEPWTDQCQREFDEAKAAYARLLATHPAPDALRVAVEALEAARDALPVRSERSRNVEVRGKIDQALAALQAEQGAK